MSKTYDIILGIESSCDETSAAILKGDVILSNVIASQKVHEQYGGVVPELASRAHQENIVPVVHAAIENAGIDKKDIDAVAFTIGPGLMGPLLVGTSFAKSFATALDIPYTGINHMQAHVLAHFIEPPKPDFPFLCLTVSGGHTQIVKINSPLDMEVLGETTDDAAGEAFDKTAKLLGLPYPGGPLIDKNAREGDESRFKFPEPRIPNYDFSFSGLKTAIKYFIEEENAKDPSFINNNMNDICASVQDRIVTILLNKLQKAAEDTGITELALAGGVSANSGLRESFSNLCEEKGWTAHIPAFQFCTDNAAMIAMAGKYVFESGQYSGPEAVPMPRFHL